jgi:outer membrane protein TolC
MKQVQSVIALLCALLILAPAGYGQNRNDRTPRLSTESGGWLNGLTRKYKPGYVPPVDISNSSRLDQIIRAGNLYLSLNDAIALALENNIDIEVSRYQFQLADLGITAAEAGNNGVSFDPVFTSNLNWGKSQQIQTNAVFAGGQSVNINQTRTRNFGLQQGFKTGGNLTFGFNNSSNTTNNANDIFGPRLQSSLQLQGTQPLLNGFGIALNTRGLRVARNNQRNADYTFQQQVNTTLNTVIQAYWNLVSASLNVEVTRASLAQAQKLLDDNRKQVEIGTLAPIEALQSEGQVANAEQTVIAAETTVLTQETNLKNLLSRNGVASALLNAVHIIPTDRVRIPDVEPVQPIQDLMEMAIQSRPDLATQRISMENTRINMTDTKNQLLPTVNLTGNISNPAGGGPVNPIPNIDPITNQVVPRDLSRTNPDLIGGYGNILRQLWGVPTVNYTFGFTVNIPLRNRAAQTALATQEVQLRTTELNLQRSINQVRADVQNALINITQARSRFNAAQRQAVIQAQVLDAEQRKLELGASTVFQVIQFQNQLATARQNEVAAQVAYANSKLALDVATGNLMERYNIVFDEAREGTLSSRPDPIPDVINQNGVR